MSQQTPSNTASLGLAAVVCDDQPKALASSSQLGKPLEVHPPPCLLTGIWRAYSIANIFTGQCRSSYAAVAGYGQP
jgi:hypothetical protein